MKETNNIDDDCGCNSEKNKEFNETEFEKIKGTMESTRDTLNQMFDTLQGMNIDFSRFNNLESEVQKMTKYMYSGEFAKSLESALEKSNIDPAKLAEYQSLRMSQSPFGNFSNGIKKSKEPIGWVYIGEDGEQKFSPIKPEDVMAMPVYGE